jgi:hypothetical protein
VGIAHRTSHCSVATSARRNGATSIHVCKYCVARNDVAHVHKDGRIDIAQLHDVEQRLLLPRVRHGVTVLSTITRNRIGSDPGVKATGEKDRENERRQTKQPAHKPHPDASGSTLLLP